MTLEIFKLEQYLDKHEFSAPFLLCCSDAESFAMHDIIAMANAEDRKLWDKLHLGYTEAKGLPVLRAEIAKSFYPGLTQDNILCFAGAEEGIFCALYALCEPSDHIIVLTPCYQSLKEIPKLKNCAVTLIALQEQNEWRIDLEEIRKAILPHTRCLVINFPHNPTGQVITQEELDTLVELLDSKGIWLFSDEVYRLIGAPSKPWAKPAAQIYSRALSLNVTSKAFGMAGLRIGWIACQDKALLDKIAQVKHYTSICNSAPSEILALIMLKNRQALLERNNQIVINNLKILDKFFESYNHLFSWVKPQGGCVGFVNYKPSQRVDYFCDSLVKEAGVLLMPASIYDHDSNHFRIGFGRKNMPEALEKLKVFLSSWKV